MYTTHMCSIPIRYLPYTGSNTVVHTTTHTTKIQVHLCVLLKKGKPRFGECLHFLFIGCMHEWWSGYCCSTCPPICGTLPSSMSLDLSICICIACGARFPEEKDSRPIASLPAIVLPRSLNSTISSTTTPQLVAEEATNTRKPPGLLTVPVDNETGPPKDTKNSASANIFAPLLVDTFTPFLTSSVDAAVFEVCQEVVRKKKKEASQPPLHHPETTPTPT